MTLSELESYAHARIGGNKPAELTGRFIAATFEHDTARPVDGYAAPQLHTHAVIFNVTEREDGSTRALQERPFFESQNYVGAVYQAEQRLFLGVISGAPLSLARSRSRGSSNDRKAYLEASNQRSQKIREHMEQAGVSGPEAAQIAAHATREGKQNLTPQEVLEAHRKMAAEFGNEPQRVVAAPRARGESAISNGTDFSWSSEEQRTERFCDAVAAATLMPQHMVLSFPDTKAPGERKWNDDQLRTIANSLGVSREALLLRLVTLKRATWDFYKTQRRRFQDEYAQAAAEKALAGKKSVPIKRSILVMSWNGRDFTRLVLRSYYDQRITLNDVSNYLGAKVKHIPALERAAFQAAE